MTALMALKNKKSQYLEWIASGETEASALIKCDLSKATYVRLLTDDPDFAKQVENARKHRADHWIGMIAADVSDTRHMDAQSVPAEKLYFDKLQFLAKADNPDRYSGSGKGVNISVNLGEFKLLSPADAQKALASDPFAEPIEVEYTTIDESDLL